MKDRNEDDVFNKASKNLDISTKKLYELWRDFLKYGKVPHSLRGRKRAVRMKLVSMEWCEPIREAIEKMRLENKKLVELPDIQKWLLNTHEISIGRSRLRYRLSKMGFIFSKTHRLTMKKEDPRIRRLRQDYLKKRHEYDKLIEENKEVVARMAMLRENNYPITDKQICYIYLDESYVNRLEYL